MRHETEVLDPTTQRKFHLIMGKAACGACHFAPVINGTVPPRFLESESDVPGVRATANLTQATLDPDLGKADFITGRSIPAFVQNAHRAQCRRYGALHAQRHIYETRRSAGIL